MTTLTAQDARAVITKVWFRGANLTCGGAAFLEPLLPYADKPMLDRLLSVCGWLDDYNKDGRPAFAEFRAWWVFKLRTTKPLNHNHK